MRRTECFKQPELRKRIGSTKILKARVHLVDDVGVAASGEREREGERVRARERE